MPGPNFGHQGGGGKLNIRVGSGRILSKIDSLSYITE